MGFQKDFVWGAATASYQIEGAAYEGGKGLSIWDAFSHEAGKVYMDQNGDIACDSYHRLREDVALIRELGIKAYRFSVSWPRLLPAGTGKVNEEGVRYYQELIDALLENGIEPYLTLYHWDLPYELQKKGGWMSPEMPDWFSEYAALIAERFSDRVSHFFTINEPQCISMLGYITGEHAPGLKLGAREFLLIHKNLLLSHGRAVQQLREKGRRPVQIGYAPCGAFYYPETESPKDIEAARYATFHCDSTELSALGWNTAMFSDPIYLGKYPEELRCFGELVPEITKEDWALITQRLDFHGQNLYNGIEVRAGKDGKPVPVRHHDGFPRTAIGWPVTPRALGWAARFLYERYGLPVYITENGMSAHDVVSVDGRVHDPNRIDFMSRYISELEKAIEAGAEVAGYFAWSLMDNFEWAYGYSERFGLVYVDYRSMERIPKDSYYFYKELIRKYRDS